MQWSKKFNPESKGETAFDNRNPNRKCWKYSSFVIEKLSWLPYTKMSWNVGLYPAWKHAHENWLTYDQNIRTIVI